MRDRVSINRKAGILGACWLLVSCAAYGQEFHAKDSGDWSKITWYTDNTFTTPHGVPPGMLDTIFIQNGNTVAYDLRGTATYDTIWLDGSVGGSSTFGIKLTNGSVDTVEIRLMGRLEMGNSANDQSMLHIGGSFLGASIEAADSIRLVFATSRAALFGRSSKGGMYVQGFATTNRNVEIGGLGNGTNGMIDVLTAAKGLVWENTYLHDLTRIKIAPATTGKVLRTAGNLVTNAVDECALELGVGALVSNNILISASHGIWPGSSNNVVSNTVIYKGRSDIYPRGIYVSVFSPGPHYYEGNRVTGFDIGLVSGSRADMTLKRNSFDGANYGVLWAPVSGSETVLCRMEGDIFGESVPNKLYDLYIFFLDTPGAANIDGCVLASDPDPLKKFFFQWNNTHTNYVTFRDFDGCRGDYRVWSGSKGVRFSAMLFPPRKTDTLTLERTSAFSSLTPTHLILTRDIRLGGFTLDPGTVLDLAGYSVMLRIGARFQIGETVYEGYQHTSSSLGVAEVIDSSDPDTGTIILEQPGTVVRVL